MCAVYLTSYDAVQCSLYLLEKFVLQSITSYTRTPCANAVAYECGVVLIIAFAVGHNMYSTGSGTGRLVVQVHVSQKLGNLI